MLDVSEYDRWMRSAKRTLESAINDLNGGFNNWACFKAHQAVEMTLKALLWGCGKPRMGHSLVKLVSYIISDLGVEVPDLIRENCSRISKYYTITRYPNAWESGAPEEYFTRSEAEEAIRRAKSVIEWVESLWRELLRSARG